MVKKAFLKVCVVGVIMIALGFVGSALAERVDDGIAVQYYSAFKGKRVALVPTSLGLDYMQLWVAALEIQSKELGYTLIIRDSNWSIDAGAQIIEQLIAEKPDILMIHPNDRFAWNKLVQKALDAGINVIQVNMKGPNNGDVFVGGDWYAVGVKEVEMMSKLCGEGSGKSGEIAVVQGPPTSPPSLMGMAGVKDGIAAQKGLKIVSTQSADWDPSKAHAVTATVLKQHPNLCGILGLWDGQDVGIAAAVRGAGLQGKVAVVTMGGGQQVSACDQIANGGFTAYVSWDARATAQDLTNAISVLLQTKPKPGSKPFALYTPLKKLTKDSLRPGTCWTVGDIK